MTELGHLVRRFAGSWSRRPPSPADLAWVDGWLTQRELVEWRGLGPIDQRHTIEVARRAVALLDEPPERAFVAGALLHDIGKREAGLGTLGRVLATVWGTVRGPSAASGRGRFARYLRHEPLGAERCAAAGSDPRTVGLVADDERAPARWRTALREADASI